MDNIVVLCLFFSYFGGIVGDVGDVCVIFGKIFDVPVKYHSLGQFSFMFLSHKNE